MLMERLLDEVQSSVIPWDSGGRGAEPEAEVGFFSEEEGDEHSSILFSLHISGSTFWVRGLTPRPSRGRSIISKFASDPKEREKEKK